MINKKNIKYGFLQLTEPAIEKAINFIIKNKPKNKPWFVGISGGKDSTILKKIVELSGVDAEYYYSATGIDPPELVKFIKQNMPDVIFKKPKESFFKKMKTKGFPTRRMRWCCDFLKKDPAKNIPLNHRLMGIRAEESSNRKKRGQINKYKKQIIYSPIFYWPEWMVWDFIDKYNLPYCKLYDEGFSRLGCVVCPFLSGQMVKLKMYKEKWPKIYNAFEKSFKHAYTNIERPYFDEIRSKYTFNEILNNWYNGTLTNKKMKNKNKKRTLI